MDREFTHQMKVDLYNRLFTKGLKLNGTGQAIAIGKFGSESGLEKGVIEAGIQSLWAPKRL